MFEVLNQERNMAWEMQKFKPTSILFLLLTLFHFSCEKADGVVGQEIYDEPGVSSSYAAFSSWDTWSSALDGLSSSSAMENSSSSSIFYSYEPPISSFSLPVSSGLVSSSSFTSVSNFSSSSSSFYLPVFPSSSSYLPVFPSSSSYSPILPSSSSSDDFPISSSSSRSLIIYSAGTGSAVTTGGWWYAGGLSADGSPIEYTCNNDETTYISDGLRPADFATSCETENGMDITFDVTHTSDGLNSWGHGSLGFDFVEQAAGTQVAFKESFDVTKYYEICFTYQSSSFFNFVYLTTDDKEQGYGYSSGVLPSAYWMEKCVSFQDLDLPVWLDSYVFNPANVYGVLFRVNKEGITDLQIKEVYLKY